MSDLPGELHEHDLPPKWNGGRAVQWGAWGNALPMHVCPPLERWVCGGCGSVTPPVVAHGFVAHRRGTTPSQIDTHFQMRRPGAVGYWQLTATRCSECKRDTVWDARTGEIWDLDLTDYGPDGSVDPRGMW